MSKGEKLVKSGPILTMTGISKEYPGVKALSNVDFDLYSGEIHALMGENGAGKSTLIKLLTGVERPNAGTIMLEGKEIFPKSTQDAQKIGIGTVYQEVNLCPNLSVAENIFVGHEKMRHGLIDWKAVNADAQKIMENLDLEIDVTKTLSCYSVAIQQMVAIARTLEFSSRVLILDEPTSSLDRNEVNKLFEIMRRLKAQGLGIIFITHFIDQVYEVGDRITILRNGELVGSYRAAELPKIQLVAKMIGKEYSEVSTAAKKSAAGGKEAGKPFFRAENVGHTGTISPFSLEIEKGEVVGLTGLLGSGRTEMAQVLFGIDKADTGRIAIDGTDTRISAPIQGIRNGIAFCPEDRKAEGIIGELSIRENIILALQARRGYMKRIPRKEQEELADFYIGLLQIKASSKEQLVRNLSGGNQQKVILARWLATNPRLLILDEPTRGIDIGAKGEIERLVGRLASEEMAILFISSELDETLRSSTRVIVLRDRAVIGELRGEEMNESRVMKMIADEVKV